MNRGAITWLIGCLLLASPLPHDVQAERATPKATAESLDLDKATQFLNRELERLRAEPPPRLKVQQSAPSHQEIDLAAASRNFLSVSKALEKVTREPKKRIDFQVNQESYWEKVDAFLSNDRDVTADDLLAYHWAGWCGTGSARFVDPHSIVLLVALVREKRFDAAAGAALRIPPGIRFQTGPFWEYVRLDPQLLAAGGLLIHPNHSESKTFYSYLTDGSDSGAKLLMQLTRHMNPEFQPPAIAALATLLAKQPNRPSSNSRWVTRKRAGRNSPPPAHLASPEIQREIIALLDEISEGDASFETALHVAKALHGVASPAAKQVLLRLHQHPSKYVSDTATAGLRGLGLTVEERPEPPPVSLVIRINGLPYSKGLIHYRINEIHRSKGTTPDGTLSIDRDPFLNPGQKPKYILIRSPEGLSPDDPLFSAAVPTLKRHETEPWIINIETKPVDLLFSFPKGFNAHERSQISLTLRQLPGAHNPPHPIASSTFTTALADRIRMPEVQPGAYEIEVKTPGATNYHSGKIILNGGTFLIRLQRGTDVTGKLVTPKGWHPNHLQRILVHNGRQIDWNAFFNFETSTFEGLPEGNYFLKIPSSEDQRKNPFGYIPEGIEFKGTEKNFRIDKNSPPMIDLGEIHLPEI